MPTRKTKTAPDIILASGSIYRKELLSRILPEFETVTTDIDENPAPGEAPAALALRLAKAKARAVADIRPESLVIGSDQVAAAGTALLGKPGDHERAARQLAASSGKTVLFYTAAAVYCDATDFADTHIDITRVKFRELSPAAIDAYLNADRPWDCAGSFRSEGLGVVLLEAIENSDPTALIGLPMIWLADCLRRAGVLPI